MGFKRRILFLVVLLSGVGNALHSQEVIKTYNVPLARQAVAVDAEYFYVINNSSITKHLKISGEQVGSWEDKDSLIHHMNSGIIIDGKLYCINSNYPEIPMVSSLEVFDPETLVHLYNHSFGILSGSATWVDFFNGFWYIAFVYYSGGRSSMPNRTNAWSRLVKFDTSWRQIESWVYPKELLERFGAYSNSGGVILPSGQILCTGHDNYELYVLEFPQKGSTLNWIDTIEVGSFGQGIAYENDGNAELVYGIIRRKNKVVVTKINPTNSH